MIILMISKDNKVLDNHSTVFARMKDLSTVFDELHLFVIGKKPKIISVEKNNKLFIYNTTSSSIAFSFVKVFWKVLQVGKKLKNKDLWVTSQDPFETGYIASMIAKRLHAKLQLQIHTDFLNPFFKRESFINRFRVFIARRLISKAHSIRVVSKRILQTMIQNNIGNLSRIQVLPVFIDQDKCVSAVKSPEIVRQFGGKKIVLCVGRLEKEKNFSFAISVFAKFLELEKESALLFAGTGSFESRLRSQVYEEDLEDKVHFIGFQEDVFSLYKAADVLLVTSDYEGYGMVIVEALACGIPVVSRDVGIAKEMDCCIINENVSEAALMLQHALSIQMSPQFLDQNMYRDKFLHTFI